MKQIGETIQHQKLISTNQVTFILENVPKFSHEPNPWRHQTMAWLNQMTERNGSTVDVVNDLKPTSRRPKTSLSVDFSPMGRSLNSQ